VARKYARRYCWVTREELEQEGWMAGLEAALTFDPDRGDNFGYHVWFRVDIAIRRFLWARSSPVGGAGKGHERECLEGLRGVRLSKIDEVRIAYQEDGNRDRRAWWARMAKEVEAAIVRAAEPGLAPIMEEVLLDGVPLSKATAPHGIPLPRALGLLRRTRYALRRDERLRAVAKELGIGV
jgi:hypothetical protein